MNNPPPPLQKSIFEKELLKTPPQKSIGSSWGGGLIVRRACKGVLGERGRPPGVPLGQGWPPWGCPGGTPGVVSPGHRGAFGTQ